MGWIHNFICNSIKGSNEIKKIVIKKDLFKLTGLSGVCIFEKKLIYIANDINTRQKYLTILHEIFHYYFRDYDGDSVECRAENSAINTLKWYYNHISEYKEFKSLVNSLAVRFLVDDELALI
jgi:Zn-dependent peptidase ImmA (M78 family)